MTEFRGRHLETGVHFVTFATVRRRNILANPRACELLVYHLKEGERQGHYKLLAWVIMPDHVHLVLIPRGQYDLSYAVKGIKGSFARKWNVEQGTQGSLWQASFYEHEVRNEADLLEKVEYIHGNPVLASLVRIPHEYPWSSVSEFSGRFKKIFGTEMSGVGEPRLRGRAGLSEDGVRDTR